MFAVEFRCVTFHLDASHRTFYVSTRSDLLDSVSRVIDGWKKQLRRQEDELQSLIAMLQKWKTTSERAALAGEASSSPATGVS